MHVSTWLCRAIVSCAALVCVAPALAQEKWPGKLVRIVVPFPAGGGNDVVTRQIAALLSERIGRTVMVDNRPGAAGLIGSEYVAKQPGDGNTLLMAASSTHAIAPSFYAKLRYDPVKDFTPLTIVTDLQAVLTVHPSVPAKTIRELVQVAKRQPGVMTYASYGNGAWNHLAIELLASKTGIRMNHIPYKGNAPATADLLGGHVMMLLDTVSNAQTTIKSGRVRALAVSSATRSALLPDVPTFAELGYAGFDSLIWIGLFGPANMSPQLTQQVSSEVIAVLRSKQMIDFMHDRGDKVSAISPAEFSQVLRNDIAKWRTLMRSAGVQPE